MDAESQQQSTNRNTLHEPPSPANSDRLNIYIQLNLLINSAGHGNHVLYQRYVNTILPININTVADLQDYRQEHIEDSDLRQSKAKQIHSIKSIQQFSTKLG